MNCKNIQKLITTDYLDNELDAESKQHIEQHLNACQNCREFAETVRATVKQPFEQHKYLRPPQSVWQAISEGLPGKQKHEQSLLARIGYELTNIFFKRRMALAMATTMFTVVIVAGLLVRPLDKKAALESYFREQAASYSYLHNTNGDFNAEVVDFGTALEEYFL